jgi:ABC-2 type transport system ATP-binding protein
MTIFLTTQYLEEADQLADRVGIINGGTIVAEGTPEELKRTVGSDLVVVHVDGESDKAAKVLADLATIESVTTTGNELLAHTADGAAAISPVAVALAEAGVRVRNLTLRTPTLDDVFLELTGNRIEEGER